MDNEMKDKIQEALFNFYLEADKDTIADGLKGEVGNVDEYNLKRKKIVNQLSFLAKAKANKERNDRLLTLVSKFQEAIEKNIEKPVAMLKQLIQGQSSLVLNNNLNSLTKEQIIEIIRDKNFVELLEQLDKKDDND